MHMVRGVQIHGSSKKKKQKPLDMKAVEVEWRKYNKDMRRKNMHQLQFDSLNDYVAYKQGKYKPKQKKEFVQYEAPKPHVRNTTQYPSLKTSDSIPESCARKETPKYTGDLLVGIGTMHKSNAVPIMRGTKQAEELAQMRRN